MLPEEHLPDQQTGAESNTESEATLTDVAEARSFYQVVRDRLLRVNDWHEWGGTGTADFQLCDEGGKEVERIPQTGDHFRIDIPGPGTRTGAGDDWVRIEEISDEEDCLLIRVRPATNPTNPDPDIAHFFSEEATSNFMIRREGNKVIAGVYGRNEKPNTNTTRTVDKLRNAAVATGAVSGFSKLQWKALVNGLVQREKNADKTN